MTIDTIKSFFEKLKQLNPSLPPISKKTPDAYFEILEEIPEELFERVAHGIYRRKLYGWPGAGEIYELCVGKVGDAAVVQLSEGEILWIKTLQAISERKPHDQWSLAQKAIDSVCGSIADIKEANEIKLGYMKREFVKLINSGLLQRGEV